MKNELTHDTAELYLDEMLAAELAGDFQQWIMRYEPIDLEDFDEAQYVSDMELIRESLGNYVSREFMGSLKGVRRNLDETESTNRMRFVWKGVFEKSEVVIIVGIHEKDGVVYANENMYHY